MKSYFLVKKRKKYYNQNEKLKYSTRKRTNKRLNIKKYDKYNKFNTKLTNIAVSCLKCIEMMYK